MRILGIESSCDESAMCVMDLSSERVAVVVENFVATHDMTAYKGVVPEAAARAHFELLPQMLEKITHLLPSLDCVAAACEPGLMGGLIMGACVGKSVAVALGRPFYSVDHIKAHALSALIENPSLQFPYICLLVSGGHTMLIKVYGFDNMQVLGRSVDDAMGEFFDKIASYLGLGFPGGRRVEEKAVLGDRARFKLKLPKVKRNEWDFSFSGLKTAFIKIIDTLKVDAGGDLSESDMADVCACLQATVERICIQKLTLCFAKYPQIQNYCVAGGVASNSSIRQAVIELCEKYNKRVVFPTAFLCTDNAVMIAFAAYEKALGGVCELNADVKSSLCW